MIARNAKVLYRLLPLTIRTQGTTRARLETPRHSQSRPPHPTDKQLTDADFPRLISRGPIEADRAAGSSRTLWRLLFFVDGDKTTQIWQWVARQPGQPAAYREHPYHPQHQSGDALIQKLSAITIPLDEEEALDLTGTVHKLRDAFDRDRVTIPRIHQGHHRSGRQRVVRFIDAEPVDVRVFHSRPVVAFPRKCSLNPQCGGSYPPDGPFPRTQKSTPCHFTAKF